MMPGCMELINVGHKEKKKPSQEFSMRRAHLKYTAPLRPPKINTLFRLKYLRTCMQALRSLPWLLQAVIKTILQVVQAGIQFIYGCTKGIWLSKLFYEGLRNR